MASLKVLPFSIEATRANSSRRSQSASASLRISLARALGFIFDQGPDSKARRAAWTARSTSVDPAAGAWKKVSPVAGLVTATVPPSIGATDAPSIRSFGSGSRGVMLRASDMEKVSLARGGRRKHGEVTPSCRGPPGRPGVVLPAREARGAGVEGAHAPSRPRRAAGARRLCLHQGGLDLDQPGIAGSEDPELRRLRVDRVPDRADRVRAEAHRRAPQARTGRDPRLQVRR